MSKRKKTDLDSVLAPASIPVRSKTESHQSDKAKEPPKVKNTFHFTEEAAFSLDELQLHLRRLTGKKLSKSEIVEEALMIAFDEWQTRKANSIIAIKMAKK